MIDDRGISREIALMWITMDPHWWKSTLVQVMAWCRQATSHYLSQCWPRSMCCHMASLGHNVLSLASFPGLESWYSPCQNVCWSNPRGVFPCCQEAYISLGTLIILPVQCTLDILQCLYFSGVYTIDNLQLSITVSCKVFCCRRCCRCKILV